MPAPAMNSHVAALRFFFTTTIDRPDLSRKLLRVSYPRKLPMVLSPEEVARLLAATSCIKHRASLSVAYGAGLRVAEVAALKVGDIDSERMLIRVERGKGGRYRNAMLSPDLLALLRAWWKEGHRQGVMLPGGWLFPGQNPVRPITTRQLSRVVEEAARTAGITKRVSPHTLRHSFATHLLEDGVDIRVIQVLLGHSKLENTALYTKVATRTVRAVISPLDKIAGLMGDKAQDRRLRPRADLLAGGRRYLPGRRGRLSCRSGRASEPRPVEGHVGDRELPYRGTRRPCRGLRRLRSSPHRL